MLYQAMQLFPEVDLMNDQLHCGNDEELVYRVMQEGTEILMGLGEVRCTKRFLLSLLLLLNPARTLLSAHIRHKCRR